MFDDDVMIVVGSVVCVAGSVVVAHMFLLCVWTTRKLRVVIIMCTYKTRYQ